MNGTRIKCLLVMIALSIIGFGPLSLTCLIGLYVVIARPRWFLKVVHGLYTDDADAPGARYSQRAGVASNAMATRMRCAFCLIVLLLLDIAPVPVTGSIGLYIVLTRPSWFKALVEKIYCNMNDSLELK